MDDMAVCTCRHIWDEHEHGTPTAPAATACEVEDCDCIDFEDSGDTYEAA